MLSSAHICSVASHQTKARTPTSFHSATRDMHPTHTFLISSPKPFPWLVLLHAHLLAGPCIQQTQTCLRPFAFPLPSSPKYLQCLLLRFSFRSWFISHLIIETFLGNWNLMPPLSQVDTGSRSWKLDSRKKEVILRGLMASVGPEVRRQSCLGLKGQGDL